MKTSLKRRVGLIGVTLALTALLLVVSVSATSAQGVGPQRGWGNCFSWPYGFTGTLPYGCGMMDGWSYGRSGYSFNPQTNVTGTLPYGYGMMNGWRMGDRRGWPGYGYTPQNNIPNTTPNGYQPQNRVSDTTPNGYNSNMSTWGHSMMGGQGHGMMGGSRNH